MKLSQQTIEKIERLLDESPVVQLRRGLGRMKPAVDAYKLPLTNDDIDMSPTLVCQDEAANLMICVVKTGEDPVWLMDAVVPAGYTVLGIKGYISQEMENRDG